MSIEEDALRTGARSAVWPEPDIGDYDRQAQIMRSLAAIGTMLGTLALVGMPFAMIRFHQGDINGDLRVAFFDGPLRATSLDGLWMLISAFAGSGLGLMLLIGSLGALIYRRWARPVLLLWASASVLFATVGSFFCLRWLLPPWRSHLADVRGVDDSLASLGGWGLGLALAIAMLFFLMRRRVKDAFERQGQPN